MSEMDGGSAFPAQPIYEDPNVRGALLKMRQGGMTLRDWFAGQAIAGLCADSSWTEEFSHETTAVWAYNLADAMLRARTGEAA